jgi:hypothetical protein
MWKMALKRVRNGGNGGKNHNLERRSLCKKGITVINSEFMAFRQIPVFK